MNRRQALKNLGSGFGMLSLAHLLARIRPAEGALGVPPSHFPAKAKRVVYLCLNGGPSHVDTFDPKPMLTKYDGQNVPESMKIEKAKGILMRSPFQFKKHGQSGLEVSEIFPRLAQCIDECCVIRSMHGDSGGHAFGLLQMNSGHVFSGHPSMGSWITYGLGSENDNLPGFIVLCPGLPVMGAQLWTSGFLPAIHQGAHVRNRDELDPAKLIHYIQPAQPNFSRQRHQLDLLGRLNRLDMSQAGESPELEASIQSMELAFRMQTEALNAFDVRKESQATRERYGDGYFARGCLMARRLLEKGVRVVQIFFRKSKPLGQPRQHLRSTRSRRSIGRTHRLLDQRPQDAGTPSGHHRHGGRRIRQITDPGWGLLRQGAQQQRLFGLAGRGGDPRRLCLRRHR